MANLAAIFDLWKTQKDLESLKKLVQKDPEFAKAVYADSIHAVGETVLFMVKVAAQKKLIVYGDRSPIFQELDGVVNNENQAKECDLTVANSLVIRKYFPFANPVSLANFKTTFGLGDRLGLASAGHVKIVKRFNVRPVFAQQSIRELNLTGRNYAGVLADAVWAVFQEDYQGGFGADGDHLKTMDEVKMALDNDYTMITLDCSEHIQNLKATETARIEELYNSLDPAERKMLESRFLGKKLQAGTVTIEFTAELLKFNAAVYQRAVDFAVKIYHELLKPLSRPVDFEMSIDETQTPTDVSSHFFVAAQLIEAGVKVISLAPRFYGEFQKGIDYIGDIDRFESEFKQHIQIAEHFGYKISVHSGSDKFSVFPIVGKESKGRVHVKTAGTNWLEAVRVIAQAEPALYREMHQYALAHFEEAKKYYHITNNLKRVPDVNALEDNALVELLNQNDARQLMHITYGLILLAQDGQGRPIFRDRIYHCLAVHEDIFYYYLQQHIGKHLRSLVYSAG